MHSHSFQDTKFKFLKQVKDVMQQVVEGLKILSYPGVDEKGVNNPQKRIFGMYSHSFQDTKFTFLRQVKDVVEQVVEGLLILSYPGGLRTRG